MWSETPESMIQEEPYVESDALRAKACVPD